MEFKCAMSQIILRALFSEFLLISCINIEIENTAELTEASVKRALNVETTSHQRRCNVSMQRCIDVDSTLYKRHLPIRYVNNPAGT